jgi:hypothetical protein
VFAFASVLQKIVEGGVVAQQLSAETMSGVPPYGKEMLYILVLWERMWETPRRRPVLSTRIVKSSRIELNVGRS